MKKLFQILKMVLPISWLAAGLVFGAAQAQYDNTTAAQSEFNFNITIQPYVPPKFTPAPTAVAPVPVAVTAQPAPTAAPAQGQESNEVAFEVVAAKSGGQLEDLGGTISGVGRELSLFDGLTAKNEQDCQALANSLCALSKEAIKKIILANPACLGAIRAKAGL